MRQYYDHQDNDNRIYAFKIDTVGADVLIPFEPIESDFSMPVTPAWITAESPSAGDYCLIALDGTLSVQTGTTFETNHTVVPTNIAVPYYSNE